MCTVVNKRSDSNPKIVRIGICIGIVLSIFFALILPPGVVARGTAIFFGICAAAFLPAYVSALYWKRATKAGVWAGIGAGTLFSVIGLVFLHRKEAAMLGICQKLFGKEVLLEMHPWPVVDPFVYSLPASILALVVVSLLTTPPDEEHINKCFAKKEVD